MNPRFNASWDETRPMRTQVSGGVRSCIRVRGSRLRPNFYIQVAAQDVLRWVPERPVSSGCSQANLGFHQRAVDHEMEHVRRARDIVDRANAQWRRNDFGVRECSTAATAEAADKQARDQIRRRAEAYLSVPAADLWREIREDANRWHQTPGGVVDRLECGSCQ